MFKPMRATDLKPLVDWDSADPLKDLGRYLTDEYAVEEKLDGCGVFMTFGKTANVIVSAKNGIDRSANFPHLRDAVMPEIAGTMIAAELVADGKEPSGLLSASVGLMVANPATAVASQRDNGLARLFVFDFLRMGKAFSRSVVDTTQRSYAERRHLLEVLILGWRRKYPDLLDEAAPTVGLVRSLPATEESVNRILGEGYEGVMIKRLASLYKPNSKTGGWFKLKMLSTATLVITGYRPGEGSNAGLVGSFEVSILTETGYREVGHCGNFKLTDRREFTAPDGSLKQKFYEKVVEVSAQGVGPGGHLRHCLFRKFRSDKGPEDCMQDQLNAMPRV